MHKCVKLFRGTAIASSWHFSFCGAPFPLQIIYKDDVLRVSPPLSLFIYDLNMVTVSVAMKELRELLCSHLGREQKLMTLMTTMMMIKTTADDDDDSML